MKSQLHLKKALITVLFVIIGVTAFAQTGKISGKVSDKKTGETLIGVTVKIKGTTKGSSTDVDGRYMIGSVTPGKYVIEASYIGYSTKNITEVDVKGTGFTSVDIVMEESNSQKLNEVVITATVNKESVNSLYVNQKNSSSISSGISAEIIKRSPDRNTSEVLKRVSGASIQDNKFIIVRGLNDRYNTALVNNSPLPSSEPDRKAFSFDVIPSNLIDNVIISKTATPDLPGDFSGGAVQIKTKDFPDVRTFEVNAGLSYNSISTFKEFYGSERATKNNFGFGGSNDLPSSFPSTATKYEGLPIEERVKISKQFKNTWGIKDLGKSLPNQNLQLIYGDSYLMKNESKIGFIVSATYRNSESISNEIRNDYDNLVPFFEYKDVYYNYNSSLGILANLAYAKGGTKISLKNIYNQSFEDSYLKREGVFDTERKPQSISQQEVVEKGLLNSVLEGDHLLSKENKSKITWNLSFSRITNDQPDLRRLTYSADLNNPSAPYQANISASPTSSSAGRFFSELSENIYGASVNYSLPVKLFKNDQVFKVGLLKQYKERSVNARVLGYRLLTNTVAESNEILYMPQDQIFAPGNIASNKLLLQDISNANNQYDGSGDLNAGYVMINGTLVEKFKATLGVRVENYIENLKTKVKTGGFNIDNNYLDVLPSVNLTYELTSRANLRASYSNTVARAQFRELAPFSFYDFVTGTQKIGNENLKRSKINNVDLRYEFYPSAGQLLSVAGFYKYLTDPIENSIQSGSTPASKTMTYINAPKAFIAGVEVEIRHDLSFLNTSSQFLKNLIYSANAALIKSEVDFGTSTTIKNKRPLQGQSPYLINTGFQYSSANSGWQTSILYNRIGRRVSVVGFGSYVNGNFNADYPDIYEAPRNLIDFQLSKKIIKQKAELKLNVSNLLDSDAKFYQDVNDDKKYLASDDNVINTIAYGRTFSLSFGYKF